MERRYFIKKAASSIAATSVFTVLKPFPVFANRNEKILNAYYLRAHMYTLVPRHIREDLKWMADKGTNAVSLGIIEQDLFAAVENVDIICNEAAKLNMDVYAVPSRWGGMVAGAPKVPSLFSVQNPQTWVLEEDGTPVKSEVSGVVSSVHYPETDEFFRSSADKMFALWDIRGIIWDEPKSFRKDYSPNAIAALGKDAPLVKHYQAVADFYSRINAYLKQKFPEKYLALFAYAHWSDEKIQIASSIEHLDFFGCDGRPWHSEDGGKLESKGKVLLGEQGGERFLTAAKERGRKSLWLIENHNMASEDIPLLKKRLPEIVSKDVDHLIYYYYPRNLDKPEEIMSVIGHYLKNFRK